MKQDTNGDRKRSTACKAALALQFSAACVGLLLIVYYAPARFRGDIAVITIGDSESHLTLSGHRLQGISIPAESRTVESRVDLDNDILRVVIHYKDGNQRTLDGCFAEYRGVSYNCSPGYHHVGRAGDKAGARIPGSLGLSTKKIAELRRQDVPGQWREVQWLLIAAGISLLLTIHITVFVWQRTKMQQKKRVFVSVLAGILAFCILSLASIRLLLELGHID